MITNLDLLTVLAEHEIIRVEKQLEKVRNDLLDSANAARTAEEARVEAVERESKIHAELEETLAFVEETTHKVALLESREAELINQLARTRLMEKEIENVENQTRMLTKLEKEMEALSIERDDAIIEMNLAQKSYLEGIADRDAQIDTLNQDVDVHREQMELAQTMLVEKETIALELRYQLEETMKEEELRVRELEEKLAAKNRDVNNIATELDERNTYVQSLEEKLATTKREFTKYRADCEVAAAASAELETIDEDDGEDDETVLSMASARTARALAYANMTSQAALLAERVEHLEREVGAGKRQMECQGVELVEKDKHIERIKVELERRKAKIDEAVAKVDERDKTIESLNNELNDERLSLNAVLEKLRNLQIDLADAKEEADAATEACKRAEVNVLAAEIESKHAIDDLENLKSEVESLRKCNESAAAEVEKIKTDAEKEKKSSIHVAATLAATNAARQAEMEAKIENMQKEVCSLA
jgi:chromosome segregation ATPase